MTITSKLRNLALVSVSVLGISTASSVFAVSANASEMVSEQKITNELSDTTVNVANSYIHFNEKANQFYVDNELVTKLSYQEYQSVIAQVTSTNEQIARAIQGTRGDTSVTVVDTNGAETEIVPQFLAKNGKTAIKFYWNFARVWISRNDLNRAGTGIAIGSAWIPQPLIGKVVGTLGGVAGMAPHGVVFDWNYILGTNVWGIKWQK